MSYTIKIETDPNDSHKEVVYFEGDFTIQNIVDIKAEILNSIKSANSIVLNIENIKNLDVTFLQLMYSLTEYCKTEEISISFQYSKTEENIKEIINKAGFSNIANKI